MRSLARLPEGLVCYVPLPVTRSVAALKILKERGMHRVEWFASPKNTPSINVAKRLGMTCEGVPRETYLYRGVRHDAEVWSVLATQWQALGS